MDEHRRINEISDLAPGDHPALVHGTEAEKELLTTRARLHDLLAASPAVIYSCEPSPDHAITFVSENVKAELGYGPTEFIQDPGFWISHIHPDHRERVLDELPRAVEQGYCVHEYLFRHKDGRWRWIHDRLRLVCNSEGKPAELVGFWMDITERRWAEEVIVKTAELWERTFDAVPDLIALVDTDNRILHVNKAMADGLGVAAQEAVGQKCHALFHGTDAPPSFCPHARMLTDGAAHSAEASLEWMGRDFLIHTSPIYDADGEMTACVHVAHDVTQRNRAQEQLKEYRLHLEDLVAERTAELRRTNEQLERQIAERVRAEEEMLESEERFRTLVEQMADGVCIQDKGRIIFSNESHWRMLGFDSEEKIIGAKGLDFIASEYRSLVRECVGQGRGAEDTPTRYEIKSRRRDGGTFDSEITARQMMLNGHVVTQVVLRDITERKRIERQIAEERQNLERAVEERTRDLSNSLEQERRLHQELSQSFEKLRKAESARDALTHMIVHDLNNPLISIAGFTNVLLRRVHEDRIDKRQLADHLQIIHNASAEMSSLIENILDVAKSEAGKMTVSLKNVDAISLSRRLFERFRCQSEEFGVELSLDVRSDPLLVLADEDLLSRVLQNLLSNAIMHTGNDTRVVVSVEANSGEVIFSVSDNGPGIPPECWERVFEPFFQAEARKRGKKWGAGLGLAFCKLAVEAQGGRIWVDAGQGTGAHFHVALRSPDSLDLSSGSCRQADE